jgi:hypothetical protein
MDLSPHGSVFRLVLVVLKLIMHAVLMETALDLTVISVG